MPELNDHDLLIALNTKMEMLLAGQQQYIIQWGKMLERMTAIEIEQGRHDTEIKNLAEELNDLSKKTTVIDVINAAIASIAGIIGYFFGSK